MSQVVSLTLFRFASVARRAWVFSQMGLARGAMARTPGIGFWKLCGTGTGEGFTPLPETAVWAILATWPDREAAEAGTERGEVWRRWRDRATEDWTLYLSPRSSRGNWSGTEPFSAASGRPSSRGPVAVLTRATIRGRAIVPFWGKAPAVSDRIGADPNVLFKIGLGEVPWLHQITFSVWPDIETMTAFARRGAHAEAIRAVRAGGWFREELYARFAVTGTAGRWAGVPAFDHLEAA